jgi:hypothetical protein
MLVHPDDGSISGIFNLPRNKRGDPLPLIIAQYHPIQSYLLLATLDLISRY